VNRTISLPAIHRTVTVGAYVKAVQRAKANPTGMFPHGLSTWWPTSGGEIVSQFREGMHDRINQRTPYSARGVQS
jgi:hypothetical protein